MTTQVLREYEKIIARYTILQWEVEPSSSRFKADIEFINRSVLMVKDYLFPTGRKYAYHWQNSRGNIICRWDNAPHWKSIETFPYHRHEGEIVFPSKEMTLDEVIRYISIRLESENK